MLSEIAMLRESAAYAQQKMCLCSLKKTRACALTWYVTIGGYLENVTRAERACPFEVTAAVECLPGEVSVTTVTSLLWWAYLCRFFTAVALAPGLAAVIGPEEAAELDLRDVVAGAALRPRRLLAADLGFDRIVDSEIEVPKKRMSGSTKRQCDRALRRPRRSARAGRSRWRRCRRSRRGRWPAEGGSRFAGWPRGAPPRTCT